MITDEEKQLLDRDGFVVLQNVLDAPALARLRDAFERAVGGEESGTRHAKLPSADSEFDIVANQRRVAAAVAHVLGRPFRIFSLGARDPLPGFGQQGLHTDWLQRGPSDPYSVVTTLWLLDDFTEKNGATRVLPGSHRLLQPLPKKLQQPESRHRDQKIIIARAGSVLVFNGHLWHSGTRNETKLPRRVLQCQFIANEFTTKGTETTETSPSPPSSLW